MPTWLETTETSSQLHSAWRAGVPTPGPSFPNERYELLRAWQVTAPLPAPGCHELA